MEIMLLRHEERVRYRRKNHGVNPANVQIKPINSWFNRPDRGEVLSGDQSKCVEEFGRELVKWPASKEPKFHKLGIKINQWKAKKDKHAGRNELPVHAEEYRWLEDLLTPLKSIVDVSFSEADEPSVEDRVKVRHRFLNEINAMPTLFLTSLNVHAKQTAQILALGYLPHEQERVDHVRSLGALTPRSPRSTFEDIIEELKVVGKQENKDYLRNPRIALVGHEPRLSQLYTQLTSCRTRPFNRGEIICLKADSLEQFRRGQGVCSWRTPTVDYQEASLRSKVQSKLTVSTFLAGFTFASFVELLIGNSEKLAACTNPIESVICQGYIVASVCLTLAISLFIASVYIYDQLTMPEGFWAYGESARRRGWLWTGLLILPRVLGWLTHSVLCALQWLLRRGGIQYLEWLCNDDFEVEMERSGRLYAHMVWTSQYVFTPAVISACVGFCALLYGTNQPLVWKPSLVIAVVVFGYYLLVKPRLATD